MNNIKLIQATANIPSMKHVEQKSADFSCTKVVIYVALTVLAVLNVVTGVFCGLSWIWQAFFGYFFVVHPRHPGQVFVGFILHPWSF